MGERHAAMYRATGAADDIERIRRFLPGNYEAYVVDADTVLIEGEDHAGWTMDDYVVPRLATGLIFIEPVQT